MVKRILHASDFSPASRSAFSMARFLAKKLGARLILFHAYEGIAPTMMPAPMMPMTGPAPGAIVDSLWAAARRAPCLDAPRGRDAGCRDRAGREEGAGGHGGAGDAWTHRAAAPAHRECRRTGHPDGAVSCRDRSSTSQVIAGTPVSRDRRCQDRRRG